MTYPLGLSGVIAVFECQRERNVVKKQLNHPTEVCFFFLLSFFRIFRLIRGRKEKRKKQQHNNNNNGEEGCDTTAATTTIETSSSCNNNTGGN